MRQWPAIGAAALLGAERDARHAVTRRLGDAALATLDAVLASRLAADAVDRVVASDLARRAAEQLLKSDELWLVVDEVAGSPAVAEAITQQGMGFADQVAGGIRTRSRRADEWLERAARRTLRLERQGE